MTQTTDRSKIDADFARLENLLKANPLPTATGYRLAEPSEFMWMYEDPKGGVGFKHTDTRCYVYVTQRCGVDVLFVPEGGTFEVFEF